MAGSVPAPLFLLHFVKDKPVGDTFFRFGDLGRRHFFLDHLPVLRIIIAIRDLPPVVPR